MQSAQSRESNLYQPSLFFVPLSECPLRLSYYTTPTSSPPSSKDTQSSRNHVLKFRSLPFEILDGSRGQSLAGLRRVWTGRRGDSGGRGRGFECGGALNCDSTAVLVSLSWSLSKKSRSACLVALLYVSYLVVCNTVYSSSSRLKLELKLR